MKSEVTQSLEELKKAREDFKREQDLARINAEMAAGNQPVVQKPESVDDQRQRAREERRRKRQQEKEQAQQEPAKPVSSLDEARAKKKASAKPTAEQKEPFTLDMDELHKWKLTALNRDYADAQQKLKEPLIQRYNQRLNAELKDLAQKDPECVAAHRAQVSCINELVKMLDDQLPEGYAITQVLTEKGVIVAQYVPNRAGKPLPLPEVATPEEG